MTPAAKAMRRTHFPDINLAFKKCRQDSRPPGFVYFRYWWGFGGRLKDDGWLLAVADVAELFSHGDAVLARL